MLTVQYGYCKLMITNDFIIIRNNEITEMGIYGGRVYERNIQEYNPKENISPFYIIPFIIGRSLDTKLIYKWDLYNEIIKFNHKTAYELYELTKDYVKYCKSFEGTNPYGFSCMRYCYIEGIEKILEFVINLLEIKFPSLKMEYTLRKW